MRSTVIAVALCLSAAAATAQCVAQAPAAAAERPGPELIRTAAADTRAQALPADDGLPAIDDIAAAKPAHPYSRRAGPAMLLAALALMSGIALRRLSARMQ
jgi:hypothetical protein